MITLPSKLRAGRPIVWISEVLERRKPSGIPAFLRWTVAREHGHRARRALMREPFPETTSATQCVTELDRVHAEQKLLQHEKSRCPLRHRLFILPLL